MSDSSESPVEGGQPAAAVEFPERGRLLGLDPGAKRVGLAVSNQEQTIASPLQNYSRRDERQDERFFQEIISEYQIAGIVVGLPVHMSGEEGGQARAAREFGRWIGTVSGLAVRFWDERFTSQLADDHLLAAELTKKQRKARRDKLAAQIMLQSYLDAPDKSADPAAF